MPGAGGCPGAAALRNDTERLDSELDQLRRPGSADTVETAMARRHSTVFACPLCRALGHTVLLEAQLEEDRGLRVVVELDGCPHADGFGDPERLTIAEEWRLIVAALDAFEGAPLLA
jgi:hypothetical protein